jgi:hypothetical protein
VVQAAAQAVVCAPFIGYVNGMHPNQGARPTAKERGAGQKQNPRTSACLVIHSLLSPMCSSAHVHGIMWLVAGGGGDGGQARCKPPLF